MRRLARQGRRRSTQLSSERYADVMTLDRLHMHKVLRDSTTHSDQAGTPTPVTALRDVPGDELAALLRSAYAGTVDDEGEDEEAAKSEIHETLNGRYGELLEEASGAVVENGVLTSAIIVTLYRGSPLIAYILTEPSRQRHGYATTLMTRACRVLGAQGFEVVNLAVTVGSQGEPLYRDLGFVEVVWD